MALSQREHSGPHWTNGYTGPLIAGEMLSVKVSRPETGFLVHGTYSYDREEVEAVFNSFLGLRVQHEAQRWAKPGNYSHPINAHSLSSSLNQKKESSTPYRVSWHYLSTHQSWNAVVFAIPTSVDKEKPFLKDKYGRPLIVYSDVRRVAMFLCESSAVEQRIDDFFVMFDRAKKGSVSLEQFIAVLDEECANRKLNLFERLFLVFEEPTSSTCSLIVAAFVMLLIGISSAGFVLATDPTFQEASDDPTLPPQSLPVFNTIEAVCIYLFTVEYLCRVLIVWAVRQELRSPTIEVPVLECFAPTPEAAAQKAWAEGRGRSGWGRTWRYVSEGMNLIDLLAILPYYLGLILQSAGGTLSVFRILRLTRVLRIFKLAKNNEGIDMLAETIQMSEYSLCLLLFFGCIGVILFGSLIYFAESGDWHPPSECREAYGDDDAVCGNGEYLKMDMYGIAMEQTGFSSIPRCFWWVMVTATTVGYGDLFPSTPMGKVVGTFTTLLGILVLALPIGIVGSNFLECYKKLEAKKRRKTEMVADAAKRLQEAHEAFELQEAGKKFEEAKAIKLASESRWVKKMAAKHPSTSQGAEAKRSPSLEPSLELQHAPKESDEHQSLAGLRLAARVTPSFLYDALGAIYTATLPDAPSGVITVDRRNWLLAKVFQPMRGRLSFFSLPKLGASPTASVFGGAGKELQKAPLAAAASASGTKTSAKNNSGITASAVSSINELSQEEKLAKQYAPLVSCAQSLMTNLQNLHVKGKIDDYMVLNMAREVQDLVRKVAILDSREKASLRLAGAQIDASLGVLLSWLSREADLTALPNEDPIDPTVEASKMDPEDQRRLRLDVFELAMAAHKSAKDARDEREEAAALSKKESMKKRRASKKEARPESNDPDGPEILKASTEAKASPKKSTEHAL